ncbi:MAG: hypothetical protein ABR915_18085 [Thermoguttaceae bacterium]|jgi:hypothetical protein
MARKTGRSVFGSPPFAFIVQYLATDDDFLSDAKTLLAIPESPYNALKDALAQEEEFLDRGAVDKVTSRTLGPGKPASDVSRFVWRLHTLLRGESDEPLEKSVNLLREAIQERSKKLTSPEKDELARRIVELVATPAALARQHKAETLAGATGKEVGSLQLICDIRPVFDEHRSKIEGAVVVSILRLDLLEADGSVSSVEARLDEQQIADLCTTAEFARNKIAVIKRSLDEKGIPMPYVSSPANAGGDK